MLQRVVVSRTWTIVTPATGQRGDAARVISCSGTLVCRHHSAVAHRCGPVMRGSQQVRRRRAQPVRDIIGALLVRDFALLDAPGGQERGYRAGTENLPAALGMAAALEEGSGWLSEAVRLRAKLEAAIVASGGEIVAAGAERIAAIGAYRMPGVSAAAQLIRFDGQGIAVSAGSACSSGSLRTSHVLAAMGYPVPGEVIRVSLGRETTEADIDRFAAAWRTIARRDIAA